MSSDESKRAQYTRFAEEWRNINTLIWEIPSVAIAIMGGVLAVAYEFLADYPRVLLLSVASFFMLSLAIQVAKHRLSLDARTRYLKELESKLGLDQYDITTKGMEDFLKGKNPTANLIFDLLRRPSAGVLLLYVIFVASIGLGALAVVELTRQLG